MAIYRVGLVGYGLMEAGISQAYAHFGHVRVSEVNDELLSQGLASINN